MKHSFLLGMLYAAPLAHSAVLITHEAPGYVQDFNHATATVPVDWAMHGFAGSGNALTYGGTLSTNSYYSLAPSASSTDYAFGGKIAASGEPGSLTLTATNHTGAGIHRFSIAYTYLQYTAGNRTSSISFSYSLDDVTYTTADLFYVAGGSTYTAVELTGLASGAGSFVAASSLLSSANTAVLDLTEALADGASIHFRFTWTAGAGSGHNAHLGVDHFSFTLIPEPSTTLLGSLGFLGALRRRR